MKIIFSKLFLLLAIISFSQSYQNGIVTYIITDAPKGLISEQYPGELNFQNEKSIFVYDKNTFFMPKRVDSVDNEGNKLIIRSGGRVSDRKGKIVYSNFATKEQVCRETISDKPFIVYDTIVAPQWVYGNQTRKIGNFLCQNASSHYYGRDYEAWFTMEIPVPFGPWKLNGLPGLIMEAKSSDGELEFVATKVELGKAVDLGIMPPESGEKIKGYLEFRAKQDKNTEEKRKHAEALARESSVNGAQVKIVSVKPLRFEKSLD